VSKGADIEIKDRWGFNAYQNALQNGHPEIAEFLNHSAVFVMKVRYAAGCLCPHGISMRREGRILFLS
jgi:hypothetical protein